MPDFTTLNNYIEKLSLACLSDIRKKMVTSLIRSKSFHRNRLLGKYWLVIVDGTGLFHFKEKHCKNCLVRTVTDEDGRKRRDYYHKAVKTKIVLSDSVVISLGTWRRTWCMKRKGCVGKKEEKQIHFMWVANLTVTEKALEEFIGTGRRRWKIKNEGFNNQKNGIYRIEHLNSRDTNVMKNYYLLT